MPSRPPQVTFKNGQLTIVAQNSTLGDILRAVHQQTGAAIEIPPNATERVFSKIGPGPARDVLASLLNGSHFNYVMLGSPTDPSAVQHVILTSKAGNSSAAPAPATANPGAVNTVDTEEQEAMQPSEEPVVDEQQQPATDEGDSQADQSVDDQNQQNGQPGVKTPEQLLRELQQQQQQQQQQPGAPQGFPPQPPQPQKPE